MNLKTSLLLIAIISLLQQLNGAELPFRQRAQIGNSDTSCDVSIEVDTDVQALKRLQQDCRAAEEHFTKLTEDELETVGNLRGIYFRAISFLPPINTHPMPPNHNYERPADASVYTVNRETEAEWKHYKDRVKNRHQVIGEFRQLDESCTDLLSDSPFKQLKAIFQGNPTQIKRAQEDLENEDLENINKPAFKIIGRMLAEYNNILRVLLVWGPAEQNGRFPRWIFNNKLKHLKTQSGEFFVLLDNLCQEFINSEFINSTEHTHLRSEFLYLARPLFELALQDYKDLHALLQYHAEFHRSFLDTCCVGCMGICTILASICALVAPIVILGN